VKITGIETVLFEPEWDDPYAEALRRTHAAITIHTDEGLKGIGRAYGPQVGPIHDLLKPVLLGEDPRNVERLWSRMEAVTVPHLGAEAGIITAIGALDIALWDLVGKATNTPCWQLLGGFRDWVFAYADIPIRSTTPEGLASELAECVEVGYRAVKFHIVSADPDHIVAETRAAREAIGPGTKLMVDVFRAHEPRVAVELARKLEGFEVHWLEEPVRWHDQPLGLALVARSTTIAIAGGECESTPYGCRELLVEGGVAILQPDILRGGGYTQLRKIAALAQAFHVRFAPHGAGFPELCAPIVAAMPNGDMVPATTPHYPPAVWSDLYEDFQIESGRIQLSTKPGLGLTFNQSFLAKFQTGAVA
jgi:D-galactarolactone cycloisomerase